MNLFEPLKIGPLTLRNRTLRAAAFEGMCPGHRPSESLLSYHRSLAQGGIGMTTVAYAAVEQSGLSFPHQLWIRKEVVEDLRRLTDVVHKEGAHASIQLGHCGNMAHSAVSGSRPLAPSARFNLYGPTWPKAMDLSEIGRVIESFVRAVELAREAGFDAVEIHAGHGYLISQFLSPYTNRRTDRYGGDFSGRTRFLREVITALRRAIGKDLALLVKTNMRDGFPSGMELDEGIQVARLLEELGVDALVLSGGFVSRAPMYIMRGAMPTRVMAQRMDNLLMKLGVLLFGNWLIRPLPYEENYFLSDALAIRGAVSLPLIYLGGVTTRAGIDQILNQGFDGVAMARALLQDPAFVDRLRREEDARSSCDHCNSCAARIYTSPVACHRRVDGGNDAIPG